MVIYKILCIIVSYKNVNCWP